MLMFRKVTLDGHRYQSLRFKQVVNGRHIPHQSRVVYPCNAVEITQHDNISVHLNVRNGERELLLLSSLFLNGIIEQFFLLKTFSL